MEDNGENGIETVAVAPEPATAPEAAPTAAATPTTPTDPNADLWERLGQIDPATLPKHIKDRVELPFKQDYTQKWQKLAEDKNQFLSLMATKLGQQPGQAPPSALAQLKQNMEQGNYEGLANLVEQAVNERIAPIQSQVAQREAFETARGLHPYVTSREADISRVLRENPHLAQMATRDNYSALPTILHGIALSLENQDLSQKLQAAQSQVDSRVKQEVQAHQAKVRGLPTSTSKVGNGTATANRPEPRSIREAAEQVLEDYREGRIQLP